MTRVSLLVFAFFLLLHGAPSFADAGKPGKEVLAVVEGMDTAWSDQDVEQCLTYFSADIDFENSFGWSVQGRENLGRFLEWLFARYPKPDSTVESDNRTASAVQLLTPTLALVDSAQNVTPPGADAAPRIFRTTHIVKYENDAWQIWRTRIWEARASGAVPADIARNGRFPEISGE